MWLWVFWVHLMKTKTRVKQDKRTTWGCQCLPVVIFKFLNTNEAHNTKPQCFFFLKKNKTKQKSKKIGNFCQEIKILHKIARTTCNKFSGYILFLPFLSQSTCLLGERWFFRLLELFSKVKEIRKSVFPLFTAKGVWCNIEGQNRDKESITTKREIPKWHFC